MKKLKGKNSNLAALKARYILATDASPSKKNANVKVRRTTLISASDEIRGGKWQIIKGNLQK